MRKIDLGIRILSKLQELGAVGATKTELFQAFQVSGETLNRALTALAAEYLIVMRKQPTRNGFGRPALRFWHKDSVPPLTDSPAGDIPTLEVGASPPPGGTCKRCGGPTSFSLESKPLIYCSPACERLDSEGGRRIADLLSDVTDPRLHVQIAILLVTIDLRARGYYVLTDPMYVGSRLMVADEKSGVWLDVLYASAAGYFPPLNEYDSAVAVYKDGRLKYGGKNPLVSEPEKIEAVKPKSEKYSGHE
jgi:hypothetical protein